LDIVFFRSGVEFSARNRAIAHFHACTVMEDTQHRYGGEVKLASFTLNWPLSGRFSRQISKKILNSY
jgi:hypothetical protein